MKFTTISNAKKETCLAYLGGINLSPKTIKNKKVGYYTYSLNLAPANASGYNVCPFSTIECRLGCLATSGHARMSLIAGNLTTQNARIKKTKLFFEENEYFMEWLIADLKFYQGKAERDNYIFSARLNTISDIDWQNVKYKDFNIFEIFPNINFYDYSKNYNKFNNKPNNYHLTYSFTGRNWLQCKSLLNKGFNVAVVFNVKNENNLPKYFNDYPVINGDAHDVRLLDKKGVIVGLKFKHIADKEAENKVLNSCFVVQQNDIRCCPSCIHSVLV
jgi:hypothetical protein